jgi:hypothetical protein
MKIEIKIVDKGDLGRGEELWINDERSCFYPGRLDGNQVAHSIAWHLNHDYGFPTSYKLIDTTLGA